MKRGYIIMAQRQSNNQWSGGIVAHLASKILSAKSAGKVFAPIFWDQDGILYVEFLPKGQTINAEYYSFLLVQLKDILKEKNAAGNSPKGSCSCTTMPWLTTHLQPRRNWSTWASRVLITHPVLRI